MIRLAPDIACMLYIGGLLLCLTILWWRWHTQLKNKTYVRLKQRRLTCELCKSEYLDESFTHFHKCPICGCLNVSEEQEGEK